MAAACVALVLAVVPLGAAEQAADQASPQGTQPTTAPANSPPAPAAAAPSGTSLDDTRTVMTKWIETQQIIARERNEWHQGREILKGRIELVAKETEQLEERIKEAEASVAESNRKRDELAAERDQLKAATATLADVVTAMETRVKALAAVVPDSVRAKLQPLYQRIPADPATTKVSVAERFQNVLGSLNELNKANSEISVNYEVRTLPDGTSAEVQALYVGLAQAYYVSPRGDAGIGRPSPEGWKWESTPAARDHILEAIEILQGKQMPAFVPLPVKIK